MRIATIFIVLLFVSCGAESIVEKGVETISEPADEAFIPQEIVFELENGDTINKIDENGNQAGLWKYYWDEEKTMIHYEKVFKNNNPKGNELISSKTYDSLGVLKVELLDGVTRIY